MNEYIADTFNLIVTVVLIILNAFFVAAEFALVKLNKSKIDSMKTDNNPFASVSLWLYERQNMALSACQMGITIASLALGWIGEPTLAHLLKPLLVSMGVTSEGALHGISFAIAFTFITSLHIVVGEQFPKIYAIRKPVPVFGWSALPLKFFYIIFYPFMWLLDRITSKLLSMVGIESSGEHEAVLSEEEIRASLSIAYHQGDLTKNEHQLLNAAFQFDDTLSRQIMLPRPEIVYFDIQKTYQENLDLARKTKHSRFPLCNGSMDDVLGIVHIKDLVGITVEQSSDLKKVAREPIFIPESLPITSLLQLFRKAKQHMALLEDEYGTVVGLVTLEHVVEQLVGNVEDEFDQENPEIVKEQEGKYLVTGDVTLNYLNQQLKTDLPTDRADTLSGLLTENYGLPLEKSKKYELSSGITAEIINIKNRRAAKVILLVPAKSSDE